MHQVSGGAGEARGRTEGGSKKRGIGGEGVVREEERKKEKKAAGGEGSGEEEEKEEEVHRVYIAAMSDGSSERGLTGAQ